MWDNIPFIAFYHDETAGRAALAATLDAIEAETLAVNPGWTRVSEEPQPYEVMPATGAIVPGKYPRQLAGRKFMPSWPYDRST